MSEQELERIVRDLARVNNWRLFHAWRSDHSPAGFPDICAVRGPRLIFAELKTMKGRVTPEQRAWLDDLEKVPGVEVFVWKPRDLDEIEAILGPDVVVVQVPPDSEVRRAFGMDEPEEEREPF